MPYISTRTSVKITPEQEKSIKTKLGSAITIIGKSESWLMVEFIDSCRLWFKGSDAPAAFVEVKLLGKASPAAYEKLTGEISGILSSELGISSSNVYVKYDEIEHWGWNGGMF